MKHNQGFLNVVSEAKKRIKELTVEDVRSKIERGETFTMIDVREESEWNNGHIEGAIHLGKGIIERDIESKLPDKNTPIVLYCGGGFRSALAADMVQNMGYTNVHSMDGGWREWTEKKLPTAHVK